MILKERQCWFPLTKNCLKICLVKLKSKNIQVNICSLTISNLGGFFSFSSRFALIISSFNFLVFLIVSTAAELSFSNSSKIVWKLSENSVKFRVTYVQRVVDGHLLRSVISDTVQKFFSLFFFISEAIDWIFSEFSLEISQKTRWNFDLRIIGCMWGLANSFALLTEAADGFGLVLMYCLYAFPHILCTFSWKFQWVFSEFSGKITSSRWALIVSFVMSFCTSIKSCGILP